MGQQCGVGQGLKGAGPGGLQQGISLSVYIRSQQSIMMQSVDTSIWLSMLILDLTSTGPVQVI